jgi:hypothetical protein
MLRGLQVRLFGVNSGQRLFLGGLGGMESAERAGAYNWNVHQR